MMTLILMNMWTRSNWTISRSNRVCFKSSSL